MFRPALGVIAGLVVGFFVIALIEGASWLVYPLPAGLDRADVEGFKQHVASLPAGAFLFVLAAHAAGSLAGAFLGALIARPRWLLVSLIIGVVLLLAGLLNLFMIPHPVWFATADVLLYLPFSLLGGWLAQRLVLGRASRST